MAQFPLLPGINTPLDSISSNKQDSLVLTAEFKKQLLAQKSAPVVEEAVATEPELTPYAQSEAERYAESRQYQEDRAQREDKAWVNDEGVDGAAGVSTQLAAGATVGAARLGGHLAGLPLTTLADEKLRMVDDRTRELGARQLRMDLQKEGLNAARMDTHLDAATGKLTYEQKQERLQRIREAEASLVPLNEEESAYLGAAVEGTSVNEEMRRAAPAAASDLEAMLMDSPKFAEAGKRQATRGEVFKQALDLLDRSQGVDEFFNKNEYVEGILNPVNRDRYVKDLKATYAEVLPELEDAEYMATQGNSFHAVVKGAKGLAKLAARAGVDSAANPAAVFEFLAENTPQLAIGAVSKPLLTTSNVGYASEIYQRALNKYRETNEGQLPSEAEQAQMLGISLAAAAAEQIGDSTILRQFGVGKAADATVEAATETAVQQASKGLLRRIGESAAAVTQAAAKGYGTEGLTEGVQTAIENDLSNLDFDVNGEEAFVGAAIGAASGGIFAGSGAARDELAQGARNNLTRAEQSPSQDAARQAAQTEVLASGNAGAFFDRTAPSYDPVAGITALQEYTVQAERKPEEVQAAKEQAKAAVEAEQATLTEQEGLLATAQRFSQPEERAKLESGIERLTASMDSLAPEEQAKAQARIAQFKQLLGFTPEAVAGLEERVNAQRETLNRSQLAYEEWINTDATTGQLASEIELANTPLESPDAVPTPEVQAAVGSVFQKALASPEMFGAEQFLSLADNTTNSLSAPQREYLRAAARTQELIAGFKTQKQVQQEVLEGGSGNLGLKDYQKAIGTGIQANDKRAALKGLRGLQQFAKVHDAKAVAVIAAYDEFLETGVPVQLASTGAGQWFRPESAPPQAKIKQRMQVDSHSEGLVDGIQLEADLLKAGLVSAQAAVDLQFQSAPVSKAPQAKAADTLAKAKPVAQPKAREDSPSAKIAALSPEAASEMLGKSLNAFGRMQAENKGSPETRARGRQALRDLSAKLDVQFTPAQQTLQDLLLDKDGLTPVHEVLDWIGTYGHTAHQTLADKLAQHPELLRLEGFHTYTRENTFNGRTYKAGGNYFPDDHSIGIDLISMSRQAVTGLTDEGVAEAVLHEVVHAVTEQLLRTDPQFVAEVKALQEQVKTWLRTGDNRTSLTRQESRMIGYALQNEFEFLTVAMTNPQAMQVLDRIPVAEGQSVLSEFLDKLLAHVRKALGLTGKETTALRATFQLMDQVMAERAPAQAPAAEDTSWVSQLSDEELNARLNTVAASDPSFKVLDEEMSRREDAAYAEQANEETADDFEAEVAEAEAVLARKAQEALAREPVPEQSGVEVVQAVVSESRLGQRSELADGTDGKLAILDTPVPKTITAANYKQVNLIAAYYRQDAAREDSVTPRPLVAVKDFMAQLINGDVLIQDFLAEKITEEQAGLLELFQSEVFPQWKQQLEQLNYRKLYSKADPSPATEFFYSEPLQFFLDEQLNMEENAATAMIASGFGWVLENGSAPEFRTEAEINAMVGRDSKKRVTPELRTLLGNVQVRRSVMANRLGQGFLQALGLKAKNADVPVNEEARLAAAMGMQILGLLEKLGLIEEVRINSADIQAALGDDVSVSLDSDKGVEVFVRVRREGTGDSRDVVGPVQQILSRNQGTGGVFNKLFAVEDGVTLPSLVSPKVRQTGVNRGRQDVPAQTLELMGNMAQQTYQAEETMLKVQDVLGPELFEQVSGIEDVNLERVHLINREGVEAKNANLRREISRMVDYLGYLDKQGKDGRLTKFHILPDMWKNQRFGYLSRAVNMQTSKIHRAMFRMGTWVSEVALVPGAQGSVSLDSFKLRVLEAFDKKTDEKPNAETLAMFDAVVNDPVMAAGIEAMRQVTFENGTDQALKEQIVQAVKKGGTNLHAMQGLLAMAHLRQAEKTGATSFTTTLTAEIDGKTNGPMLSLWLLGAMDEETAQMGGFYTQDSGIPSFGHWKPGNLDLYQRTAKHMNRFLAGLQANDPQVNSPIFAALFNITGKLSEADGSVSKDGRNIVKNPLTTLIYGSGMRATVDGMADKFIETIYERIEQIAAGKKYGTQEYTGEEALQQLAYDLAVVMEASHINFADPSENGKAWKIKQYWNPGSIEKAMEKDGLLSKEQETLLRKTFANSIGAAMQDTIQTDLARYLHVRGVVTQNAGLAFELHRVTYENLRARALDSLIEKKLIPVGKDGKPLHDLTAKQEGMLREALADMEPRMHTAMSLAQGDAGLRSGIYMAKTERHLSNEGMYSATAGFAKNSGIGGKRAHGYRVEDASPGVSVLANAVQSNDGANIVPVLGKFDALGVHDALVVPVHLAAEAGAAINNQTFEHLLNYSIPRESYLALERTLMGMAKSFTGLSEDMQTDLAGVVSKSMDTLNDAEQAEAADKGVLTFVLERAKRVAFEADTARLGLLSQMAVFDQYTLEEGVARLTDAQRQQARDQLQGLTAALDPVVAAKVRALDKAIAGLETRDAIPQEATAILTAIAYEPDPIWEFVQNDAVEVVPLTQAQTYNLQGNALRDLIQAHLKMEKEFAQLDAAANTSEAAYNASEDALEANYSAITQVLDEIIATHPSAYIREKAVAARETLDDNTFIEDSLLMELEKDMVDIETSSQDLFANDVRPSAPMGDPWVDMNTEQLFDALRDPTAPLDGLQDLRLRSLLNNVIGKVHGPFESWLAQAEQQQAMTPLDALAKQVATGQMPFVSQLGSLGVQLNAQQQFMAEMIELSVAESLVDNTREAERELYKLYTEARNTIKPANLPQGQVLWNALFETPQGETDARFLSRFAALALVVPEVQAVMGFSTSTNVDPQPTSLYGKLLNWFNQALNWLNAGLGKGFAGQQADAKLDTLVHRLADLYAGHKLQVAARQEGTLTEQAEGYFEGVSAPVRKQLENFGKSKIFQQSKSGYVKLTGSVISMVAGERVEQVIDGMTKFYEQNKQGRAGILASMVNEIRHTTLPMQWGKVHLLLAKLNEKTRKEIIQDIGKLARQSFADQGQNLTKLQKKALTSVLLRSGASVLNGPFTLRQLEDLLRNPQQIKQAIAQQVAQLKGPFKDYYVNQAHYLGYFLATGQVKGDNLRMNAMGIALLHGTEHVGKVPEDAAESAARTIDILASLQALAYTSAADKLQVASIMEQERNRQDGGNGVDMILKLHGRLLEEARQRVFEGSEALMMKGYLPEIFNPYTEVVVVRQSEVAALEQQGYRQQGQVQHDSLDVVPAGHVLMSIPRGLQQRLSGTVSTTGMRSRGSRPMDGQLQADGTYAYQGNARITRAIANRKRSAVAALFKPQPNLDPSRDERSYLAPVSNANGDTASYRYMMEHATKDRLLERTNDFDQVLGTLASTTFDKEASKTHNEEVITKLHEQYQLDKQDNPQAYIAFGPRSTDPEIAETWRLLPENTKQFIRKTWGTEGMLVRRDTYDLHFGYRKYSLANMFDKTDRNHLEQFFVFLVRDVFRLGDKAALRVRQAEDIVQAVVTEMKDFIVVKSGMTLFWNQVSNLSLLWIYGVPVADIVRSHRAAFKGATAWQKDSSELRMLEQEKAAGYSTGKDRERDRRITELQTLLQRNPVRGLIEAGMMPTIVEDVAAEADQYAYKPEWMKSAGNLVGRLPEWARTGTVAEVGKQLYVSHDTALYKVLSQGTQLSDFMARYTLYQHMTSKKRNTLGHDEAVRLSMDAFVNYDVPSHKGVQYLNDMGLLMFTKYYMRIQTMILHMYRNHPARGLLMLLMDNYFQGAQTIVDSTAVNQLGWPFHLGPFNFFDAAAEGIPAKMLGNLFR